MHTFFSSVKYLVNASVFDAYFISETHTDIDIDLFPFVAKIPL